MSEPASLEPVSAEHNGIILSGVGVSEESLTETMETRTAEREPTPEPPVEPVAQQPGETPEQAAQRARDEQGRFAKPTRAQNRIERLAQEKNTEKQAREAAEQRAADLEKRLAALEQARPSSAPEGAPPAAPRQSEPAPAAPAQGAPKLAEFVSQIGTTYQDYEGAVEAYTEARIAHQSTDFDARIRTSIEADRASRAFQSHLEGIFEQGRKAYPDFDAVRTRSSVQFPDLRPILNAPNAPDLIYALSKDDALAQKIAAITDPVQLGWALAQVVTPQSVASPASTAPAVSNAPAPYQPVGSGSKTTVPTLDELAASGGDDYDASGYRERRRTERQQSRR